MVGIPAASGTAAAKAGKSPVEARLKDLVREASHALALLDADRLEELAECCRALNRETGIVKRRKLSAEAREAVADMAVLARVLKATRANLDVMERLRDLRQGRLEYSDSKAAEWQPSGGRYGND
jgi:hypothetical protein